MYLWLHAPRDQFQRKPTKLAGAAWKAKSAMDDTDKSMAVGDAVEDELKADGRWPNHPATPGETSAILGKKMSDLHYDINTLTLFLNRVAARLLPQYNFPVKAAFANAALDKTVVGLTDAIDKVTKSV
jgi:hypothetical protein